MGQSIKLTTGTVSSTNGIFDDKTQFQISAPIQPGNSGSPIIDKYGNVIGIAVSSLKTGQNVNYGLKAKLLGDFPIDKVTSKKNKMPPFNSLQKYICLISVETDRTYFPGLKYSKGNFDVFPTSSFKSEVSKENPCSNTSLDQLFSKEYEIYDGIKVEPKMKAILDDKYANAIYQTYKLNNSWDNYDSYLKLFALLGIGAYENIVEDVEDLNPDLLTKEEKRNYLESNFIPYSIAKLQVLKNAPVESSIQSLIKKTNDAIEISTDYRKLNPNTKEDIDNDKKLFGAYYRILAHLYLIIDDKTNVQLNYNNATKYVASNINDVNDQEIISYLKLKNK
jgi:hypothetical protein